MKKITTVGGERIPRLPKTMIVRPEAEHKTAPRNGTLRLKAGWGRGGCFRAAPESKQASRGGAGGRPLRRRTEFCRPEGTTARSIPGEHAGEFSAHPSSQGLCSGALCALSLLTHRGIFPPARRQRPFFRAALFFRVRVLWFTIR